MIGLTSPRNEPFVRGLGVYDEVATYDAIDALPRKATAFIDVAGDERVRATGQDRRNPRSHARGRAMSPGPRAG